MEIPSDDILRILGLDPKETIIFKKLSTFRPVAWQELHPNKKVLKVYVSRMRKRLKDIGYEIENHRGVGYQLLAPIQEDNEC